MRKADEREAAEMLRRLLDAVERGELTANTPPRTCGGWAGISVGSKGGSPMIA